MKTNQSKLAALTPKVTIEGKEITFAEFLSESSGSGELYEDYVGEMLASAIEPGTEWNEVDDLIGPIAHHIIDQAIQVDWEIYEELVIALKTAWEKLKQLEEVELAERNKDQEIIINEDTHDVLHVVEGMIHNLRSGWEIKDATFHGPADMKVILTKTNEEKK